MIGSGPQRVKRKVTRQPLTPINPDKSQVLNNVHMTPSKVARRIGLMLLENSLEEGNNPFD